MEKIIVHGGRKLSGEVVVSGAKNAVVAIIPAAILVKGTCVIENVPDIQDVRVLVEILDAMGADVCYDRLTSVLKVDCSMVKAQTPPVELVKKMRASYYLIGVLLGRYNKADVALPGGCNFGSRPIDQHIRGFEALGAKVICNEESVVAEAECLSGNSVYLDIVSVGATINIMLAAVLAKGVTTIENVAKEPHIVDLANFLNAMGANIKGAGTDVIKITGVETLSGGTYSIIPDQIEAGTFMVAAAATGGNVLVKNVIPKHMEAISAKLMEMGADVLEYDTDIRVIGNEDMRSVNIKTLPYPGFPTDMQPQVVALLSVLKGESRVTEGVWDSRFQYVDELLKMGADIEVSGRTAVIKGVSHLVGQAVKATDLRGGAGVVIAGLIASGKTVITEIKHIDRGYERLVEKLKGLGADIERVCE